MTTLNEQLQGEVIVVYQIDDIAFVQSFWGRYVGETRGHSHFEVKQEKQRYGRHQLPSEITVNDRDIVRVMRTDGASHKTIWKRDMQLDPQVQAFYDSLSDVCDTYCKGWAGVVMDVFFKAKRQRDIPPEVIRQGVMLHESLDEAMLSTQKFGKAIFLWNVRGWYYESPIRDIEKILVYSWPNGGMGGRREEVGWQAS